MEQFRYGGETARDMDKAEREGVDACMLILAQWANYERNVYTTEDLMVILDEMLDRRNQITEVMGDEN